VRNSATRILLLILTMDFCDRN